MKRNLVALSFLIVGSHGILAGGPDAPKFGVLNKWTIGGDGGWDCLTIDPDSQRLFVSRGTHVMVIDAQNGKVVGDIPNTQGVHGIAIDGKLNKGFISNGRDNSVSVIDLKTLKETNRVKVGTNPDCIMFDASTGRVFTFNGGSSDATAIDPKTDQVVGTIKLMGKPEFPASDGHGMIFVNIEDKSSIEEFDAKTLKSVKSWSLAPAESPSGIGYDPKTHRTFSTCDGNMLAVSDTVAGKVIGTPKIGNGPDGGGFDPKLGLAFSSNGGSGTLTIVQGKPDGTFEVLQDVPTQLGARTMALDAKRHLVYLITAEFEPQAAADTSRRRKMIPGTAAILVVGPVK